MGNFQEMGQQDHEFLWLPSICLASLPPICLSSSTTCPLLPWMASLPSRPCQDRLQTSVFCSIFPSGNLSTTELILMNPPPTFLPLPMKGKATGLVSLTMLVTNLLHKFSLRTPTTLSSDLLSGVPITPPLMFMMSCLQVRAIFLAPTLSLMKIDQASLTKISFGVSQSVKTTHHSTLIPHLWQLSL